MSAHGGAPTRITTNSEREIPVAFKDNDHVLFSANIMPTAESNLFASREFSQVYEVSTQGGRPKLYSVIPMEDISINAKGQVLYHDSKGYEDQWRKHHTSPITRDIWMRDNGKYQKITAFKSVAFRYQRTGDFQAQKNRIKTRRYKKNSVFFLEGDQ